jgi:hypothetical protein
MSVIKRTATCECGKYSAECIDQPIRIGICRCNTCLEGNGKNRTVFAFYLRSKVKLIDKKNNNLPHSSDIEPTGAFTCKECGYTLIHEVPIFPELISVDFINPDEALFEDIEEKLIMNQTHDWYKNYDCVSKILF